MSEETPVENLSQVQRTRSIIPYASYRQTLSSFDHQQMCLALVQIALRIQELKATMQERTTRATSQEYLP